MSEAVTTETESPERFLYWKSLLKIQTSVSVTLAHREMPVDRILKLVPGMMIQFAKSCETPMTLEIDDQPIADCDVVKVGDRFGIKVSKILDRPEHWIPLLKEKK